MRWGRRTHSNQSSPKPYMPFTDDPCWYQAHEKTGLSSLCQICWCKVPTQLLGHELLSPQDSASPSRCICFPAVSLRLSHMASSKAHTCTRHSFFLGSGPYCSGTTCHLLMHLELCRWIKSVELASAFVQHHRETAIPCRHWRSAVLNAPKRNGLRAKRT